MGETQDQPVIRLLESMVLVDACAENDIMLLCHSFIFN